jgi:hypothetical protein
VKKASADSRYDFFVAILQAAYSGKIQYKTRTYQFKPRLLRAYDILRKIDHPQDDFDRFVVALDKGFVSAAKSELYRTKKGWIDKAFSSGDARLLEIGGQQYLVPRFSKNRTVGIDTSSIDPDIRLIGIFVVPDESACGVYFDKHLGLPKTHNHAEWKWSKLNSSYRQTVLGRFEEFVQICCAGGLLIETDVLSKGKAHFKGRLTGLIEGCFSGYENFQGKARAELRAFFYSLINNTPVHCDSDFHPLSTEDVVRTLVRQLAKVDSYFQSFVPVNVALKSHESLTIQTADILVGAIKELRKNKMAVEPFKQLPFDMRKIRQFNGSFARSACFVPTNLGGQVQPTVIVPDVASSGGPVPR